MDSHSATERAEPQEQRICDPCFRHTSCYVRINDLDPPPGIPRIECCNVWARAKDELLSRASGMSTILLLECNSEGNLTHASFGTQLIEHGGSTPGFRTQIARFPDDDLGIVILSNSDTSSLAIDIIKFHIAELYIGLKHVDWNARY